MFKRSSTPFVAFLQATCLVLYLLLLSFFFNFVIPQFDKTATEFYAPIIMLLLFIVSAVISATLVLGRAGMLFFEKKYKDAFTTLGWTILWALFYFVLIICCVYWK